MDTASPEKISERRILDLISYYALIAGIFLVPIFFIPSVVVGLSPAKSLLLWVAAVIACLFWAIDRLRSGRLTIFKTSILGIVLVMPLVYLVSGLISGGLIGEGFSTETFFGVLLLTIFTLLSLSHFRNRERLTMLFKVLLVDIFLLAIFLIIRLIDVNALSFGIFSGITSTPAGSWNDLGIFAGLGAIISLFAVQDLGGKKLVIKIFYYAALVVSVAILAAVNFSVAWIGLGIVALVLFIYRFSVGRGNDNRLFHSSGARWPISAAVVGVISLIFICSGLFPSDPVGTFVSGHLGTSSLEVRPSWQSTLSIAGESMKSPVHAIFGVGPGNFVSEWLLYKPTGINATPFWSVDFGDGVGWLPTALVTTGLLGIVAWLTFIGLSLWLVWKMLILAISKEEEDRRIALTLAALTAYLIAMAIFYVPGWVPLVLMFISLGALVSFAAQERLIKRINLNFGGDPVASFVSVFVLLALMIAVSIAGVVEADRFLSGVYAGKAVALGNSGSTDYATINALLTKAESYYNDPLYYLLETSVGISELSATVNEQNVAAATQQAQFQSQLSAAISAGQEAVTLAPGDYQNWLALGQVYEAIVPLGIQGSYNEAKAAYQKAEALDPTSPTIPYMLGRLEAEDKNYSAAETDIQAALNLKNDDTDAIFLLAQIQIAQGDVQSAIQSVQAGSVFTPTDAGVFFQLGFLKYYVKDYAGAAAALTTAIQITPDYANAEYFLGLSDYALGNTQSAITEFQSIEKSNPGNAEVETILANLESGKNPLAGITPPAPAPQNRATPPINENSQPAAASSQ